MASYPILANAISIRRDSGLATSHGSIGRAFRKFVPKEDYAQEEKIEILHHLYSLSKVPSRALKRG